MSGYKAHLLFFLFFTLSLYYVLYLLDHVIEIGLRELIGFFVGAFYSILADIDSSSSKVRWFVTKTVLLACLILIVSYILTKDIGLIYACAGVLSILFILWSTKHRGIFHTYFAAFVLSLPFLFLIVLTAVFSSARPTERFSHL